MFNRAQLILATLIGSAATPLCLHAAETTAARCVAIVGTNDVHGVIEPVTIFAQDKSVHTGGVVGMSAYVSNLRSKYGKRMVLVDGGDLFQGTLASNLSGGKAVIDAFNLMGYDASAIGNHEFDFGGAPGSKDRLGIIKQRIAEANFPFLTLNIFDRTTGQRVAWPNTKPSFIRDFGGIKVGVLGASTPDTPKVTRPQNVTMLEFRDPAPLIVQEARALRRQGAEIVLLVAHMGGKCSSLKDPNNLASCDTDRHEAELLQLLQNLPPGTVDVAVGGHTHQFVAHWVNGTATIESGSRAQYLAYVEACLDGHSAFDVGRSTIHPATELCLETWDDGTCHRRKVATPVSQARFLDAKVEPMPQVTTAVRPYLDAVRELQNKPVGVTLTSPLSWQTLTGVVAESMRRSMHADFGLQNRGGIRAELPAGAVTYGQIFGVLPFDNFVVKIRMTGKQVSDLYTLLGRYRPNGGPTFTGLSSCKDPLAVTVCDAKGIPLDPAGYYFLATSDFLMEGGDGADVVFKQVPEADKLTSDVLMRDALISMLAAMNP